MNVLDRFLSYVTYWTTSDDASRESPSTSRQKDFGHFLMQQMQALGLAGIAMDASGNVTGTLPATCPDIPVIALVAHMDTSPDAPGRDVHPQIVLCTGAPLEIGHGITLCEEACPGWQQLAGQKLIVTDGATLLGADDKAGVAEIMATVQRLCQSNRPHGEVRIVFTTDEEIGQGTRGLDVAQLACQYAYTVDGGPLGELEYENFNAADGDVIIHGVNVHPGSAKGIMRNALTCAMEFHRLLPTDAVPERTCGYEGFLHLHNFDGDVAQARLHYIIRDHDRAQFTEKKQLLHEAAAQLNSRYGADIAEVTCTDTYYNMKEYILPHLHLIARAKAAFMQHHVTPLCQPIRGGTDGATLSRLGLPCPNLSTGGYQFHSVREFIPIQSLFTMVDVLEDLVCGFAENADLS